MRLTSLNQLIREGKTYQGTWQLNRLHEISYRHRRQGVKEEILLTGELLVAKPTGLAVRVLEQTSGGATLHRVLTLRGRWQADPRNRLKFLAERSRGSEDTLAFTAGWEVSQKNELIYRFEQTDLKTKRRRSSTLTFRGYWDIDSERRLTYVLDRASDSVFRFRGAFQTPSVLAKEGAIRYQLGVEVEGRRQLRTVTLFGKWKLSRELSLEFEIPYADGSVRPVRFGATYLMGSDQSIIARLTTDGGRPLGYEVILTRDFLKGEGEAFLRLRKTLQERAIEGGLRFPW